MGLLVINEYHACLHCLIDKQNGGSCPLQSEPVQPQQAHTFRQRAAPVGNAPWQHYCLSVWGALYIHLLFANIFIHGHGTCRPKRCHSERLHAHPEQQGDAELVARGKESPRPYTRALVCSGPERTPEMCICRGAGPPEPDFCPRCPCGGRACPALHVPSVHRPHPGRISVRVPGRRGKAWEAVP